MDNLNKTWKGIYYSEFVAAWNLTTLEGITPLFKEWLLNININGEFIPAEVIVEIMQFATITRTGLVRCAEEYIKDKYEVIIIESPERGGN